MANKKDELKARLMETFRVEAQEHLQTLGANLLALERSVSTDEIHALAESTFREMHTLKGAARSVSLADVEALCQASESLLSRLTRGHLPLTRTVLQQLNEAMEGLSRLLTGGGGVGLVEDLARRLERAAAEPTVEGAKPVIGAPLAMSAPEPAPTRLAAADTLRVATAKLDALTLRAEDLLVPKLAAAERAREALSLAEALNQCRATLGRDASTASAALGPQAGAGLVPALRAAATRAWELHVRLAADARAVAVGVDALFEEARRLRMTPAVSVLDLFPAMVRDLAQEQGKDVEWAVRGADLEVDRRVLEALKDPLIHLVRNAVDHGIESPGARVDAGKASRGRVAVTVASLEGGRVELRVEDDGGGIDPRRVREAAVRAGLLAAGTAESLADEEAIDLVYRSGLTTSPIITEVSGHGLGLAIVKECVERLRGRLSLETRVGAGTTVSMVVPASIATFRGLLVRAGDQAFLLPVESVERVIRVAPEEIVTVEGREAVPSRGHPLFVARLRSLLQLDGSEDPPEAEAEGKRPCALVRSEERVMGVIVDEVLGDREVLVKDLRPPLLRVRNVAGAGLLGTGQVVLILRPSDLLRSAEQAHRPPAAAPAPAERRPSAVLVVDDSITTRTMEKNLLEAAGYEVRVAVDGIDAWTLLRTERFDIVVSDVDMPRMDGFDLTARVRADPTLADLPVVLVTALESREDKERGIEVGADAYVVKSSFDQSNLLEIIRRLV